MTFTRITAPISGRLSRRLVDPGNLVQADTTPLTTIVSLDPLYRLLRRRRADPAEAPPADPREEDQVPRGGGDRRSWSRSPTRTDFPHKGVINFSDNRVDPGPGTLRVRASIANPKPAAGSSRPACSSASACPVGDPRKSIMIAEKALGTDQGQKYLYVVDKRQERGRQARRHAAPVRVTSASSTRGMREIEDGPRARRAGGRRTASSGVKAESGSPLRGDRAAEVAGRRRDRPPTVGVEPPDRPGIETSEASPARFPHSARLARLAVPSGQAA